MPRGNVRVSITADDQTSRGLRSAESNISRFGHTAQSSTERVSKSFLGGAASAAKFAATSAGIASVGVAIAKVASTTVDFDKSMRNVNSIAQLSEKNLGALEKQVLALSGKTAQAPKTLADGLYDLVSSGFNAKQSMTILASSAKAATAGLTTTEISTKAVAAVLNAYHRPAKDAAQISDDLFQTVNRGVISFEDLATTIGDVLPFASSLGVGLKPVGAAISTMTKEGLSGAEATTRLKNTLVALIKPSNDMQKAIKGLGYDSGESLVKAKGFQGAIEALIGTTDGSKESIAKLFPNIRALGGALALTGNNTKSAEQDLKNFKNTSGATDTALSQQSKSVSYQWNKVKAVFAALAIEVGSKLIPVVNDALQSVGKFVQQMSNGTGAGGKFADTMRQVWSDLKPVLSVIKSIGGFLADQPRLLEAAAGAFVTWRLAAAAASTFAKAKLVATFLGLGPKAAVGGAEAGAAFGTASSTAAGGAMRRFGWAGIGRFAAGALATAFIGILVTKLSGAKTTVGNVIKAILNPLQGRDQPLKGYKPPPGAAPYHPDSGPLRIGNTTIPAGKKARGGKITTPTVLVGEEAPTYPEFVISTNPRDRPRMASLVMQAARTLGLPGFRTGGVIGPQTVSKMQSYASSMAARNFPYVFGGGHSGFGPSGGGFDCSGFVSAILGVGGAISSPMAVREPLASALAPGPGRFVTVGIRGSSGRNAHTMIKVGNQYFESGGGGNGAHRRSGWNGAFEFFHPRNEATSSGPGGVAAPGGLTSAGANGRRGFKITGRSGNNPAAKSKTPTYGQPMSADKLENFYSAALTNAQITTPDDTSDDLTVLNAWKGYETGAYNAAVATGDTQGIIQHGGALTDINTQIDAITNPPKDDTTNQDQIDALNALNAQLQQMNDLLTQQAADRQKLLNVSQSQYQGLFAGFVAAISGDIGGKIGLGYMTPSVAGSMASY